MYLVSDITRYYCSYYHWYQNRISTDPVLFFIFLYLLVIPGNFYIISISRKRKSSISLQGLNRNKLLNCTSRVFFVFQEKKCSMKLWTPKVDCSPQFFNKLEFFFLLYRVFNQSLCSFTIEKQK